MSTLSDANRDADSRAFAALMKHIREIDGEAHTVVMIQVENEVGVLGPSRDHSPAANQALAGPVPKEFMDYLQKHKDALIPEMRQRWEAAGFKTSGTWEQVFGAGIETDEIFMAWNYARYVGHVAAADKAEYPLPMFVNTWLRQAEQAGNPSAWETYKPVDDFLTSWGMNFRLIGPMQREIARLNFEGKLQAVAEEEGRPTEILPFGNWNAEITFGVTRRGATPAENQRPAGRMLVAQLADNQFLVTGYDCRIDFRPAGSEQQRKSQHIIPGTDETPSALIDGKWQHRQFLRLDQVTWGNGAFKHIRTWGGRGGETNGLYFGEAPVVLRVSLTTY